MHQWRLRPRTAVGHQVSTDLLHWTRVADALTSGNASDQQCYDGSASLVVHNGTLKPVLMIDGGCGLKGPGTAACMESSGTDTGGIIAFPEDMNDAHLTNWTKHGPTVFKGCNASSGPSPMWKNGDKYNLIAIHNGGEARFESTDETLGSWKMADPVFIHRRGGGGGLWHELPPNVDGVEGQPWPTHIFQANGAMGDGRPTFILGIYDAQKETYTNVTDPTPLDIGRGVAYGQLSLSEPGGEPRVLHASWLVEMKGPRAPDCSKDGTITAIRDVRFDPRIERLVENPIAEYEKLRKGALFDVSTRLHADKKIETIFSGAGGTTMDTLINIAVPPTFKEGVVSIGARCGSVNCTDGARITLGIGAAISPSHRSMHHVSTCDQCGKAPQGKPGSWCNDPKCTAFAWDNMHTQGDDVTTIGCAALGQNPKTYCLNGGTTIYAATESNSPTVIQRVVNMKVVTPEQTQQISFPMLAHETVLPLRLMSDRRTVEIFAGYGRGVFSGSMFSPDGDVLASCEGNDAEITAKGWAMASIGIEKDERIMMYI